MLNDAVASNKSQTITIAAMHDNEARGVCPPQVAKPTQSGVNDIRHQGPSARCFVSIDIYIRQTAGSDEPRLNRRDKGKRT
jgi:hypothetical protein